MDNKIVQNKFAKMGARAVVGAFDGRDWSGREVAVDIRRDAKGEYFDIRLDGRIQSIDAVDVRPDQRHLLLMVKSAQAGKRKFLCGHDERAWFVAAVPEVAGVSNVATAMEALKPAAVRQSQSARRVRPRDRNRRRNKGFIRQGEWFFIPQSDLRVDESLVLRDEPIRRGAGKPHMVQELYRTGGEAVYVSAGFPNGLTEIEVAALRKSDPIRFARQSWRPMVRNAGVFARGRVSHSDHATIVLPFWHKVEMNTESRARAMRNVAFLD